MHLTWFGRLNEILQKEKLWFEHERFAPPLFSVNLYSENIISGEFCTPLVCTVDVCLVIYLTKEVIYEIVN